MCSIVGFGRRAMGLLWARSRSWLVKRRGPRPGDWPRSPNWYAAAAGMTNTRTGRVIPGMPPPQRSARRWGSGGAAPPIRWTSGLSLRYRLPRVAELFMEGLISSPGVRRDRRTAPTCPGPGAARADRFRDRRACPVVGCALGLQTRQSHRRLGRPIRPRRFAPESFARPRPCCSRRLPVRRVGHHRDHRSALCHRRRPPRSPLQADGPWSLRRRPAHHRPAAR